METSTADEAADVVTELALANELLAACIGRLSLRSLPCVASVNHRWRDAARAAFESQLRWRAEAGRVSLPLPVPAVPARGLASQIGQTGFSLTFLRGGDLASLASGFAG